MSNSIKEKTAKGIVWSSVERFSVQGIQFIVMLVIARILNPMDFGLVGMLAIFMGVAQTFVDCGFSQALIRKQDRTETDNSTVFFFNIVVSCIIYMIFYISAPWVSMFFDEPKLCYLMRVLCLIVIVNSFAVVQRALYTANVNFKTQAKASFISAVTSGIVCVFMAYNGCGVWTLVWQQLLYAGINTILLWMFSRWHPKWLFSWKSFRELFSFGSKLLASALLDTLYTNLYTLVIGKFFSADSLGQYTQADRFTKLPSSNVSGILQRVTYPILCGIQNDDERLRKNYRKLLRLAALVIFPMMCLLAGVSYPLVDLLIGPKWKMAAELIIPLSFTMMWWPIHAINLNLLQVKGRSDLFLRLEIIKKAIGISILAITVPFGVKIMCYASIGTSLICLIVNTYYSGKLINVGFLLQMQDLLPTIVNSIIVFVLSYICVLFINNEIMQLSFAFIIGSAAYVMLVSSFNRQDFVFLKSVINKR